MADASKDGAVHVGMRRQYAGFDAIGNLFSGFNPRHGVLDKAITLNKWMISSEQLACLITTRPDGRNVDHQNIPASWTRVGQDNEQVLPVGIMCRAGRHQNRSPSMSSDGGATFHTLVNVTGTGAVDSASANAWLAALQASGHLTHA
jgi:hypothetical protein